MRPGRPIPCPTGNGRAPNHLPHILTEDSTMLRTLKALSLSLLAICPLLAGAEPSPPQSFQTADQAAKALTDATRGNDPATLTALFGAGHEDLLSSGDEVEDKRNRANFVNMANKKMTVETLGEDKAILHVGEADWPFPIPLVKTASGWQFDANQGKEEILDRRIGRNELATLDVIRGYVEAQFDYANADRDGDGVSEYAQKLRSEPGKQDGLFWEPEPGQPASPLGPLVAEARAGGYELAKGGEAPVPYHGYLFRILTRQGPAAPGGKYDYVINGNMIAGFSLVAFPAQYGASGIMSFIVNHQGRIFQKDLGPQTAKLAEAMKEFNPDPSWTPVEAAQ